MKRTGSPCSALSLIELLVVMAIIGLLAAATIPAFNSLKKAGSVTSAAEDLGGVINLSHTRARAQNTWFWVGIRPDGNGNIVIRAYQSKDGTFNLTATNLVRSGKDITLQGFKIAPVPAYTANPRPALDPATDLTLTASGGWLCCSPAGEVKASLLAAAVDWSGTVPNIPAQSALALVRYIEIGLAPSAGNPTNTAAIQVAGLTGQPQTYRP